MDFFYYTLFACCTLVSIGIFGEQCPMLCQCKKGDTLNTTVWCNEKNTRFQHIPGFPDSTAEIDFQWVEVVSLQSKAFSSYKQLHTLHFKLKSLQTWSETALDDLHLLKDLNVDIRTYAGKPITRGYFRHLTSLRTLYLTLRLTTIPDAICDLTNIEALYLPKNGLTHIKFPDCFQNLHKLAGLFLNDNEITSIKALDFVNLPSQAISTLVMDRNALKNISSTSLSVLSNLKVLSLSQNKLQKADFISTLPNLARLNIASNQLTDMSWLRAGSTLQFLQIGSNVHLDVNFSGASNWCKHLLSLDISGVPLYQLNSTWFLDLIYCPIHTMVLHDCKINSINENTFSPLHRMEKLDLRQNNLSAQQVERGLSGINVQLQNLILDNNPLIILQSTILGHLKNAQLTTASLQNCVIRDIQEGTFDGLTNLQVLHLDNNELTQLTAGTFRNTPALEILSLHGNTLSRIDSAKYLGLPYTFREFDIGKNAIGQLQRGDLDGYQNLRRLVISRNPINTISISAFRDLENLRALDASYLINGKSSILKNVRFVPNIQNFDFQNNDLICESQDNASCFAHQYSLQTLRLTNNPRFGGSSGSLAIQFQNMPTLTTLLLSNCGIKTLPTSMWTGTSSLQYLELSDNAITTWEPELFLPLVNLTTLILSHNGITYIDKGMFKYLLKLQSLFIGRNRFACDCHLLWFNDWAHHGGVHIMNIGQKQVYQCASPPEEKGNWILEMGISQADCRLHWKTVVILSVTIPVLFILASSLIVYYFRWYFRYILFLVRSRHRRYKLEADQGQYEYDVFVAYNQVDRFWVIKELLPNIEYEAGFKLCIHHRDWLGGVDIMENIQESIDRSRKTIAVLTNAFAKSQWCQVELTFAHGRLLDGVKDSLVLVLLEDIEPHNQTALLRHLLTRSTYLAWPKKDKSMQENFWRILKRSIRRPNRLLNAALHAPNNEQPTDIADLPRAYRAT